MNNKKRAVTIGLIASAILGAGYAIQKQPALASVLGYQNAGLDAQFGSVAYTAGESAQARSLPRPPRDMRPPLQPANRPLVVRALPVASHASLAVLGETDNTGRACGPALDAVLIDGAIALLALEAPCNPGARVDIRHSGLEFSGRTDADGRYSTAVPALTILATFEAFVGTQHAQVTIAAPDAANMRRVAVQWQGDAGLGLHALEFGAVEGGPGHVWGQAPGRPWAGGGTLMRLGRADLALAEVYSFPANATERNVDVDVSVQADVNDRTCGRLIEGQAIQTQIEGIPVVSDLRLEMPQCDAEGVIPVLKKSIGTIKIAAN